MKIQVNNSEIINLNILFEAELLNIGSSCSIDNFKDFSIYHSFDFGNWKSITIQSFYDSVRSKIKVPWVLEIFNKNVELVK